MKVKALVERGNDGKYGVHIDLQESRLGYVVTGNGNTAKDAVDNFLCCYNDMRKSVERDHEALKKVEIEFEFVYDVASFLNYYSEVFTKAGLERLTGVAQKQLGHYSRGRIKPSQKTIRKIESAVHNLAKGLTELRFN